MGSMSNKVYIIHNPDRMDRYILLLSELENQGIKDYELMPAMHDDISAYRGINKAHKNVIQFAKDNNLESVIVMEDDCKFFGKGAYDYWIRRMPDDYDLWLSGIFLGEINEGITEKFTGLTLYKCHNRFYDTFLSADSNEQMDVALWNKGIYKVCNPFITRQHNNFSDNEKKYMNYDFFFEHRNTYKESTEYY